MNKSNFHEKYITAIDIGSSKIACIIAEEHNGKLELKGYKIHRSEGIRNGQIADMEAVQYDIARVLDEAENMAGVKSDIVVVNAAVNNISSVNVASEINVSGHPISDADINRLIATCTSHFNIPDYKILHCIPTAFHIDSMNQVKDPRGMYGGTLGVQIHIISANKWHLKNMETVMDNIHVESPAVVATPYASALACLNDYEKDLGTILIDIGAGTTSICVYYDNQVSFSYVLPVGGLDITKSIAQRLTISLSQAEKLKISHGSAFLVSADKHEVINIAGTDANIKKSELSNVIAYRVEEMFEMIKNKLKEHGLYQLPLNRVVLTGGGSQLQGIKELASAILDRTVIVKNPVNINNLPPKISMGNFSTCCGLLQFALENPEMFTKKKEYKFKKNKIFKWFLQNF